MKQQVNDINSTLTGLLSELKELRGTIDSQHSEICSLNRNIDKLLKENRELRKRLEKYESPLRTPAIAVRRHRKSQSNQK